MSKKRPAQRKTIKRPKRAKLSAKESLSRMEDFLKRKDQFVAAIRKAKNPGLSQT
jgi:hypothetical protein